MQRQGRLKGARPGGRDLSAPPWLYNTIGRRSTTVEFVARYVFVNASALDDQALAAAVKAARSRGATVGFSINYLKLVVRSDLIATAQVRRRGGSICVAEVTVVNEAGEEVALATITYKLDPRG